MKNTSEAGCERRWITVRRSTRLITGLEGTGEDWIQGVRTDRYFGVFGEVESDSEQDGGAHIEIPMKGGVEDGRSILLKPGAGTTRKLGFWRDVS